MQGRDAEENRAAVPTLVYGYLELTIAPKTDLLIIFHYHWKDKFRDYRIATSTGRKMRRKNAPSERVG
ncbi:hypothetical protein Y032_0043g898 [Ancylostoma ceylanicum]|uniref:Uncharacterized protein n=1 Tax=Ancylostoma ceylanicum TaxID=53326 RepID=A0A016UEI7_9BILA|nr:hypothetical protein Y032_0043g898 [Ancylostoma ceylanicum]